jgi:hypothetical protein
LATVDDNKLDVPDIIAIASVTVFFIASFLPWFRIKVAFGEDVPGAFDFEVPTNETVNGWSAGFPGAYLPLLLGLALLFLLLGPKLVPDLRLPDLPPYLPLVLGGAAAFLVLVKLVIGEDIGVNAAIEEFTSVSVDSSRSFGIFLAFLATLGMVAAGFLKFQEANGGGGGSPTSPPPPPPP